MGFSSIFKRKNDTVPVGEPVDEVQRARTRARQRLIGAVVLLAIGIIGFPIVFETQPRPIPVDIPIEIPRKDGLPPLAAPPSRNPVPLGSTAAPADSQEGRQPPSPGADDIITESRDDVGREAPAASGSQPASGPMAAAPRPAPARQASAKPDARTDGKAAGRVESKGDSRPATAAAGDDGARARALLEGKVAAAPPAAPGTAAASTVAANDSSRFIVQVGAFADAVAAQDTRQKIERLGLKTYTQVASTPAGPRIRVRVGPFPSRSEADKALAKARGAGLSAVVLGL